jgi:phosphoribosyl-AMP cyclohydrolase
MILIDCCGPSNEKITAFAKAATLIVSQNVFNNALSTSWQDIWVWPDSGKDFMNVLNDGASKVILEVPKHSEDQQEVIKFFPLDRIIWEVGDLNTCIDVLRIHGCQFLFKVDCQEEVDMIIRKYESVSQFYFYVDSIDSFDIYHLNNIGSGVIIGQDLISVGKYGAGDTTLGDLLCGQLSSDRPDGLFPTIVTDEQGIALGLCYSSKESLNEAIRIGIGVYWSRKRGLWIKGETSGATQELVSISLDCDRDTLRFAVRQKNPGKY